MNEPKKENNKNNSHQCKSKCENFIIEEFKERIKIKHKENAFKSMIDIRKEQELQKIEDESKRREQSISEDILALESALDGNDVDKIKAALKEINCNESLHIK